MPLAMVAEHLSINELYRLSWGAKNAHGEAWEALKTEFDQRLIQMEKSALQEGWLTPQGVYGYWPCQSEGNALLIYDPQSVQTGEPEELTRFIFPRQEELMGCAWRIISRQGIPG